jgi:hypothetical protein
VAAARYFMPEEAAKAVQLAKAAAARSKQGKSKMKCNFWEVRVAKVRWRGL